MDYTIHYHIVHMGKGKVWVSLHAMDFILYMTFLSFLGRWDIDGGSRVVLVHQMIDCENEHDEKWQIIIELNKVTRLQLDIHKLVVVLSASNRQLENVMERNFTTET